MPEMANLVYNMYMHMIQTSQKHRQVLTVHHPHMFKDKHISAVIRVKNLTMKSKMTAFFSLFTSKSRAWLPRRPRPTPRPRRSRPTLRTLGKKPPWSRNLQRERQSLRAAQQKKVQQKAAKCRSTRAETATARGVAPSRSSSVHARDPLLLRGPSGLSCVQFRK